MHMLPLPMHRRSLLPGMLCISLILGISLAPRAEAASFYAADAKAALIIKGFSAGALDPASDPVPADFFIDGFTSVFFEDAFFDPGAAATASAIPFLATFPSTFPTDPPTPNAGDLLTGDGLALTSFADGSATSPPTSGAFSDAIVDGVLELTNESSAAVFVHFDLIWEWAVTSSADDTIFESAAAFTSIFADVDGAPLLEETGESDVFFGGGAFSDGGVLSFIVEVPAIDLSTPGFASVSVFVDAFGSASSDLPSSAPVPEPSTFVLLGSGLIGLVVARRRKAA